MKREKSKSKSVSQIILIVRHAHRSKSLGRDVDNGLSKKGINQAKKIKKFFAKKFGKKKPVIFSSPKKRCVETIEPIAKKAAVPIELTPILDEGEPIEGKINSILLKIEDCPRSPIILCSHGDLIPSLVRNMIRLEIDLCKGGLIQINKESGRYRIEGLYQDFDFI